MSISNRDRELIAMATLPGEPIALQTIGDVFGLTRERVRQILSTHGVTKPRARKARRQCAECDAESMPNRSRCDAHIRRPGRPEQTHCMRGHELSGRNLYITPRGSRRCRDCMNARVMAHYYRHRAATQGGAGA